MLMMKIQTWHANGNANDRNFLIDTDFVNVFAKSVKRNSYIFSIFCACAYNFVVDVFYNLCSISCITMKSSFSSIIAKFEWESFENK